MNFFILLASVFLFARSAFAVGEDFESSQVANIADKKSRKTAPETPAAKCSKELQAIIYTPETCAYQYLDRIAQQIRQLLPQIFMNMAAQNLNALTSIGNQYQVNTYIIPAYGYPLQASYDAVGQTNYIFDSTFARNMINFEGFGADPTAQVYNYQFILVSNDANLIMVRISLPFANAPVSCSK